MEFARALIALKQRNYPALNEMLSKKVIDIDETSTVRISDNMKRAWDDPNYYDGDAFGLLHHAVLFGDIEAAAYLLYKGADVNLSSGPRVGYTPLHCCALTGNYKMAAFLMSSGADARAKNAQGLTVFDMTPSENVAFHNYFKNNMNASTDASIVSYLLKSMSKKSLAKLAYALKRNAFDTLFATIAWIVYTIIRREKLYLDEIIFKKIAKKVKNGTNTLGSTWSKTKTDAFKKLSNSLKIREFASYVEEYLNSKVQGEGTTPGPNFEDLVVDKVRKVADSLKETGVPVALSKHDIFKGLSKWTTMTYRNVQNAYRTEKPFQTAYGKFTNASLKAYLRNFAPRAPNIIPGIERPTYLYRGMHGPLAAAAVLDEGLATWKGYLAFSRNIKISEKFGKVSPDNAKTNVDRMGHVLFQIKVDEVPKGTPWVWYITEGTNEAEMRRKRNTAKSGLPEEEVLFPQGTLKFKSPEDRAIARAISRGIDDARNTTTRMVTVPSNGKRKLTFDTAAYNSFEAAVKALTIALRNEPRKKNVSLRFDNPVYKRVAHMIQLAFLDRGIVDYVIDKTMFEKPLMIDVTYVNK